MLTRSRGFLFSAAFRQSNRWKTIFIICTPKTVFGRCFRRYSASICTRRPLTSVSRFCLKTNVDEECDIEASKDSAISNVVPADIPSLVAKSEISHIFCNGKASLYYLLSAYPEYESITTLLPSTSPANAQFSLEKLIEAWKVIIK